VAGRIQRIVAETPVTFRPDSPRLTDSGSRGLDAVVRELAGTPGTRVTVTGYAAVIAQGMGADPLRLSQQRAAAVTTRMSAAGIGADRVEMRGASNSDPRPTVAGSRRVEFAVS
jgi:outer membrane protein OmpA-like peptidoglycan-associated protein